MFCRGYSIEQERDRTYSAYGNGMYEVHTGFASIEAAKAFIDNIKG